MLLYQSTQNCAFGNLGSDLLNEFDTSCDSYQGTLSFERFSNSYNPEASSHHEMFDCDQPAERVRCVNTGSSEHMLLNELNTFEPITSLTSQSLSPNSPSTGFCISGSSSLAISQSSFAPSSPFNGAFAALNAMAPLASNTTLNRSNLEVGASSYGNCITSPSSAFVSPSTELEYSNSNGSFNSPPHSPSNKSITTYPFPANGSSATSTSIHNAASALSPIPNMTPINLNVQPQSIKVEFTHLNSSNDAPVELKLEDIDSALDEDESELGELFMDDNSLGAIGYSTDLNSGFMPTFARSSLSMNPMASHALSNSSQLQSTRNCSLTNALQMLPSTPTVSLSNTPLPPNGVHTSYSRTSTPSQAAYSTGSIVSNGGFNFSTNNQANHSQSSQTFPMDGNTSLRLPNNDCGANMPDHLSTFDPLAHFHFKVKSNDESCDRSISQCSTGSYEPTITSNGSLHNSSIPIDSFNAMRLASFAANSPYSFNSSIDPFGGAHNAVGSLFASNSQLINLTGSSASSSGSSITPFASNKSSVKNALFSRNDALKVRSSNACASRSTSIKKVRSSSSNRTIQKTIVNPVSLLCAVCGDTAACQHYGVRTCEGCKGFFKRTVQKASKYVCLANRECVVDKRRRNRCQFCRFQKCLAVGMVKEVVRTDSLKGRRGRLPSRNNEKHPHAAGSANAPISTIAALESAFNEMCAEFEESCEQAENKMQHGQRCDFVSIDGLLQQVQQTTIEYVTKFARNVPTFESIPASDQALLIHSAAGEFASVLVSYYTCLDSDEFVYGKLRIRRSECDEASHGWLSQLSRLMPRLEPMYSDSGTVACLLAICLLGNRFGLSNSEDIEMKQMRFIDTLRDHITYDAHAQQLDLHLSKLLGLLSNLRSLSACLEPMSVCFSNPVSN